MIKRKYKNEYYHAGDGLWVRNFTKSAIHQIDINDLTPTADMQIMLENELQNKTGIIQTIESESFEWPLVAIIGDGFNLATKQKILDQLPPEVTLIGVNNVMNLWAVQRRLNFYVINNPFPEATRYLPKRPQPRPRVIASIRTCAEFLKKYDSITYQYTPIPSEKFGVREGSCLIDDYRNPICAAMCLAFKFKVKKLLLFCCDGSFRDQRPGAEKLPNGLWMYPQQNTANYLVDGCSYWLASQGIEVRSHSSGPEYKFANYIIESDILKFMTKG